jgi:hypothetical protein
MRADLHVHSKFSTRPSQWFLQKVGCPESFTEPETLYRLALQRGMSLVTITDHNRIEGALEIAHLPRTFVSEEITSYFPEDRCKVHVLAYHITESQHADIQKLRPNLFDLVTYLQSARITHAVAHPLYAVNDRLQVHHFEQMLLLFKNFELNGDCNPESNRLLVDLLSGLTPAVMERLADKHGFAASFHDPWRKNVIGGSDDHSSLNIARNHTLAAAASGVGSFLRSIDAGQAEVVQRDPSPQSMAQNLYSIAYQFYRKKLGLGKYVPNDLIVRHIDRSLRPESESASRIRDKLHSLWKYRQLKKMKNSMPHAVVGILRREASQYIHRQQKRQNGSRTGSRQAASPEMQWFQFVNRISNVALVEFADQLFNRFVGADLFNIFQTIGSAGGFYTLMAPYFVAYSHYSRQRRFNREIQADLAKLQDRQQPTFSPKVAVFVDEDDPSFPAGHLDLTPHQEGVYPSSTDITVISCREGGAPGRNGYVRMNFDPLGSYEVENETRKKLYYPPIMEMLDFCYRHQFTHIHLGTCGPIGLTGLFIARLLNLPATTAYQVSLPDEVLSLTHDEFMEDLAWKYNAWFYNQMERVFIPTPKIGRRLVRNGVQRSKLHLLPRAYRGLFPEKPAKNDWHRVRELILDQDLTQPLDGTRNDRPSDDLRVPFSPTDLPKARSRMPEAI